MNRYHFTNQEIEIVKSTLDDKRVDPKWVPAVLALAARRDKEVRDTASALAAAVKGTVAAWTGLQIDYRVDLQALGVRRDNRGGVDLGYPGAQEAANQALYTWLAEKYDLDRPSHQDRIETLEKQVKALTKALSKVQKSPTPAPV